MPSFACFVMAACCVCVHPDADGGDAPERLRQRFEAEYIDASEKLADYYGRVHGSGTMVASSGDWSLSQAVEFWIDGVQKRCDYAL